MVAQARGEAGKPVIHDTSDFDLGELRVRPGERTIVTAQASVAVEPLVMNLLTVLSASAGHLVSRRDLFARLWGATPIGDDSLNRAVAMLRKALRDVGAEQLRIETIPGTGYSLRLNGRSLHMLSSAARTTATGRAIAGARDSWRLAWPEPDHLRLETMRQACVADPEAALAHAWLAMLCRYAAEYSDRRSAAAFLAECEASAKRALALDTTQAVARVALISVAPLYGRWLATRPMLAAIADEHPHDVVAAHDLATLDMATGRIGAAKQRRDALLQADPLAACHCYKSVYQNWSCGDHAAMDQAADRAMQLWPLHPAVWTVRLWTLAYTGRAVAARDMVDDPLRPVMPAPTLAFLRQVLSAVINPTQAAGAEAVAACRTVASQGPAHAIHSMTALGLLDQPDETFAVASAYYFRDGPEPVPLHHGSAEPVLNEQHRRLTQILFTPVFAKLRDDPRFSSLCTRTGLSRYWDESGLRPDFEGSVSARKAG